MPSCRKWSLGLLLTVLMVEVAAFWPAVAAAQSTTGTITGRVVDAQGLAAPGATIVASSPNLQGTRTTVTSPAGDYILTLLPPGNYTIDFDLPGFARAQKGASLAPAQTLTLDATLGPAAVSQVVQVTGSADVLTRTAQVGTNVKQAFVFYLPTNRDIFASLQLAPSVHSTGPAGGISIGGGMSFANLILLNGVSISETVRGQPYQFQIEDAVEQTTIGTAGISAEYGRFTGGVVNVVTKSGGNRFSGSLRDTLANDSWRTLTPFEDTTIAADPLHRDTRIDKTIPTYEYTFGGPVLKDRLWFFAAGRHQVQESPRTLVRTLIPYIFKSDQQRYEGKATWAISGNHRLRTSFAANDESQFNQSQNFSSVMDSASLYDMQRPTNLFTAEYNAILSPQLSIEARISVRNDTLKHVGGRSTDLIGGTLLLDGPRRYWSPTFCGVCGDEQRDGQDVFLKGSYFLSKPRAGSHTMSFGYDGYDDRRFANNYQSGSNYRITAPAILRGTELTAQFVVGSTFILWQPIQVTGNTTNFRTHSGFYSDNWRLSDRVNMNLGLRYDRNHSVDSSGHLVATTDTWSPRVGIAIDPSGDQRWAVTASVAKYVDALANTIANAASAAGNADAYQYAYGGPNINENPNGPLIPTAQGLRQLFDWFSANQATLKVLSAKVVGLTPIVGDALESPGAWDYAGGISRQFGAGAALRADVTYRRFGNFYALRTDTSTGTVSDTRPDAPLGVGGTAYDLSVIENTDLLERQYAALSLQAQYRLGGRLDVGATYTLSRVWGNVDGEAGNGPTANGVLQYPEYKQESWNYPIGDLSTDQRHRARLWASYQLPWVPGLAVSGLQTLESGVPYGAVSANLDFRAFVQNPGYQTPPAPQSTQYYFTDRDAFRTEGQRRTDLAVSYVHGLKMLRGAELFGQLQILNVFNEFQLCACGASTALQDGISVDASRIDMTISTPPSAPSGYQQFNPLTSTPVEGVDWAKSSTFGQALSSLAYTTPRTMRLTFGVRF